MAVGGEQQMVGLQQRLHPSEELWEVAGEEIAVHVVKCVHGTNVEAIELVNGFSRRPRRVSTIRR